MVPHTASNGVLRFMFSLRKSSSKLWSESVSRPLNTRTRPGLPNSPELCVDSESAIWIVQVAGNHDLRAHTGSLCSKFWHRPPKLESEAVMGFFCDGKSPSWYRKGTIFGFSLTRAYAHAIGRKQTKTHTLSTGGWSHIHAPQATCDVRSGR